jgi:two-component system alkaline phosphatase synthesis response regulator PhoP
MSKPQSDLQPNRKVLIVDDDQDLQDIMKMTLEDAGYDVLTAENGKEALEVLESNFKDKSTSRINCIILDLMMPVMSGDEMLDKLRIDARFKDIPVIISTAKGSVDQKSIDKAQEVIKKPFSQDQLYSAVNKHSRYTH